MRKLLIYRHFLLFFVYMLLILFFSCFFVVIFSYVCQEEWPTAEQYYHYTLALLTLQFVVPLFVLIFTYTRIALTVWGKRPPGEAVSSRDQRLARSKRKVSDSLEFLRNNSIYISTL